MSNRIKAFQVDVTDLTGNITLGDIGDIAITSPADNDILIYDSVSGTWKNEPETGIPSATWGSIVGTISNQLDLQSALDGKMVWKNEWAAGTYSTNEVVRDGDWTMVANKTTTERAGPEIQGIPRNFYQGTSPTSSSSAKQLIQGTRYTFASEKFVNSYRIYTIAGNTYDVFSVKDPLGAKAVTQEITFSATKNGWQTLNIDPILGSVGDVFDLMVIEDEPDPSPTTVVTSYNYQTQNNETVPASGEIRHATKKLEELWINKTDNNAVDRSAMLAALVAGDIIELDSAGDRYSIQAAGTDFTTYYKFIVAPAQTSVTGVQNVTFETTTISALTYVEDVDWWLTGSPSTSEAQGMFIADGDYNSIVPDNTAYGVDIIVQDATISADWDILSALQSGTVANTQASYFIDITTGTGSPLGITETTIPNAWTTTYNGVGDFTITHNLNLTNPGFALSVLYNGTARVLNPSAITANSITYRITDTLNTAVEGNVIGKLLF